MNTPATLSTRQLRLLPAILVLAVIVIESVAWYAGVTAGPAKWALAAAEMILLVGLLWNGWRIRRAVATHTTADLPRQVATLVFASLAICLLGDLVNRNLPPRFFSYDNIIEHSYLADSVWLFFPGYALFIVAAWRASRARITAYWYAPTLLLAAIGGALLFLDMLPDGTATYIRIMTGAYTMLIAMMVPAGLWILLAFGRRSWPVALGAVLATVADALIGQFWLFGTGWFPAIAFINLMVYFLSQALIQQLPLVVLAQQE